MTSSSPSPSSVPASSPSVPPTSSSAQVRDPAQWVLTSPTASITSIYKIGRELGQPGQFGRAALVTHLKTGEERAVKIISKIKFSRAADRKIHFQELRTEIEIMQRMDHTNIIKLFDVFESLTELFIVMEVCTGGELFDRIKAQPDGSYTEKDATGVLRQICEGLKYLHSSRLVHADLKPDNFLFSNESKDSKLKIIDFGMSKFVKRRHYFKSLRGTPYYIAPEVIRGHYTEHCDMWSLGVVMFVMLFGYPPFHADNDNEIFRLVLGGFDPTVKKGYRAHFPADIPSSSAARDLIGKLLTTDTAKRLTAAEALEHPWMTGAEASSTPMITSVLTNLKQFTANNTFKNGIVKLMTSTLSNEELAELKRAFQSIDEDGSGTISASELAKAIEKTGGSAKAEEVQMLLKMADVNGDGQISYDELVMTSVNKKLSAKEERLWNAFNTVDTNRDGKLSAEEISAAFQGEEVEKVKQMIKEIDKDGDGNVDFEEFIDYWMKKEESEVAAGVGINFPVSPTNATIAEGKDKEGKTNQ